MKEKTKSETANETKLEAILESGLEVIEAVFHKTVKSGVAGLPETAFYAEAEPGKLPASSHKSRIAHMVLTPHGLVCSQKGKITIVPLANVAYTRLK